MQTNYFHQAIIVKIGFLLLFLVAGNTAAFAQQQNEPNTQKVTADSTEKVSDKELNTNESISYMGDKLLFQVRKRLHLTTEEEEKKAQEKKSKKVKLSFLGIVIEKEI